jgi:ribosomal protein L24
MLRFAAGKQVTIRYGKRQGQEGTVLKVRSKDVYLVRMGDGTVLYFSEKGLEEKEPSAASGCVNKRGRGAVEGAG